ncbi:hypothetical protein HAX54_048874 [Datura stramonium]|uniref:Uncharacterized protein n=1 Tax=Datura stramonium TaxID=4076 RepID=A0ABS8WJT6_DATST|nr:hypothetical protein [Datura stramonium]
MTGRPDNIGVIIKDVLRRTRVNKGKRFSFGTLLTRFLREQQIDVEVVDYRPRYNLKELNLMKTKDSEDIYGPVLSNNEHNARIDNVLNHLYSMKMLQLRIVGLGFEEPFDDDDAIDEEQARVVSYLESDDDGDDSDMGELLFPL